MLSQTERAELAAQLRRERRMAAAGQIGRRGSGVVPPASFGQEQLWFLDRFAPGLAVYNI
ncbi:MAG: hypothetical protein JO345_17600, partial [Streptosporangiaceae bacterium]|nr:hypothetical protein [Streptosporangiaceae bacterium]